MDGSRFDDLTKSLARRASRRDFLGGATAIVALLGARGAGAQTACPSEQVARRGIGCVCRATGRPPGLDGCPCPAGQTRCGDACVSGDCCVPDCTGKCGGVSDDCGGTCSGPCTSGRICLANGTCALPCPIGGCGSIGCSANRCIGTDEGALCSQANGAGGCSNSNADCPIGRACSGAVCEVVC